MEIEFYHLVLFTTLPPVILGALFYKFVIPKWFNSLKQEDTMNNDVTTTKDAIRALRKKYQERGFINS